MPRLEWTNLRSSPPDGRFRFSLLHLAQAIALIAFALAASREEEYAFSALLRSGCVGVLLYGLACQVVDLWKARRHWESASGEEWNGLWLAIFLRLLVMASLLFSAFSSLDSWLRNTDRDFDEFNTRLEAVANAIEPLTLVCGLALATSGLPRVAPSRRDSRWRQGINGAIALGALGGLVALTWFEASFVPALVHIAINGVVLNQPLHLDKSSSAQMASLVAFTREALSCSFWSLGLALGAGIVLYAQSRLRRIGLRALLVLTAAGMAGGSASVILWLKQVALPRISPLLASNNIVDSDPLMGRMIAGTCLVVGALAMLWMESSRMSLIARPWRRTGWYPQETRFFYEVLLFSLAVENAEIFHEVMGLFSQVGPILTGNVGGVWVSLTGVFMGFLQEPMQLAILALGLGGLLARRKDAPSAIEQTPAPVSLLTLLMGAPIAAICAYLIAESMLWSNFLYWISAT